MQVKSFEEFLNEQAAPTLMTILANPTKVGIFGQDNTNQIYLAQRDVAGKVIPGTKHTYNVKGEYGMFGFDVTLRKVRRDAKGNLLAEAMPKSTIVKKALSLIPEKNKTPDGWVYIEVPNKKVNDAIALLKSSQGKSAEMEAGSGITVTIEKV